MSWHHRVPCRHDGNLERSADRPLASPSTWLTSGQDQISSGGTIWVWYPSQVALAFSCWRRLCLIQPAMSQIRSESSRATWESTSVAQSSHMARGCRCLTQWTWRSPVLTGRRLRRINSESKYTRIHSDGQIAGFILLVVLSNKVISSNQWIPPPTSSLVNCYRPKAEWFVFCSGLHGLVNDSSSCFCQLRTTCLARAQ